MNSKKPLITIIIIIVVLVAGGFLWRGGYFGQGTGIESDSVLPTEGTGAGQAGAGEQAEKQTGTVGKMTDDIYVELIVQAAYQAQKNPATYVSNMRSIYEKYGITEENINAYGVELGKDPARAQAVAQKYSQQLIKLQQGN